MIRALMKIVEKIHTGRAKLAEISAYLGQKSTNKSRFSQVDSVTPADLIHDFEHAAQTQVFYS